jgi:hypothetical protein
MSDIYDKYTIPEMYRHEWDATIIKGYTQPSAHLSQFAMTLPNPHGEYVKMQMIGKADVHRRKQRHEKKVWTEPKGGERRVYPVMFASSLALSDDDFVLKGGLPLDLGTLHDLVTEAAQPYPDRVFLGSVYDEEKRNCVVAEKGDFSPYYNPTPDEVNVKKHEGQPGGLLGYNRVGRPGEADYEVAFPQKPLIGGALADYSVYASSMDGLDIRNTSVIHVNFAREGKNIADSGLTIEKLRAARLALTMRYAIQANEEVCMAITPWQMDDLLNIEKLQNKDYGFQSLNTGIINKFLNIRFLVTQDVPIVNIGGKWVRSCPIWKRTAAAFGTWQDSKHEVVKLDDYYDTWVVSLQFAYGAARRREEDIICVHCDEVDLRAIS